MPHNARPVNILLVEDDPGDQNLTKRAFERAKIGNRLFVVEDGEEALDFLLHRGDYLDGKNAPRPDLILLDLNLPKLDGPQVLDQIRSTPELRRIPIVVLTTSCQEEDILRSYDLGVNSYISKPVRAHEFVRVVEALENYWFQIVVLPRE